MYSNAGLYQRRRAAGARPARPRWLWYVVAAAVATAVYLYARFVAARVVTVGAGDGSGAGGGDGGGVREADAALPPALRRTSARLTAEQREKALREMAAVRGQAHEAPSVSASPLAAVAPPPPPDGAPPVGAPTPAATPASAPPPTADPAPGARGEPAAAATAAAAGGAAARPRPRALIFTMDSITDYVSKSKSGGPAGEIIVRESLEWGLRQLGIEPVVADSDAAFAALSRDAASFSLFFLDPWTFVDPGWRPRPFLVGREAASFCLSFFGMPEGSPGHGWALPPAHVLTPYPVSAANTFLGFVVEPRWLPRVGDASAAAAAAAAGGGSATAAPPGVYGLVPKPLPPKKRQGVLWGKRAEYLKGRRDLIAAVAAEAELHTTAGGLEGLPGVVSHGHLTVDEWHALLAESKFMLGLGDPLIGPSGLDAVAAGTVFINPTFKQPRLTFFGSQHPFLRAAVGGEYVCDVDLDDTAAVLACVRGALGRDLPPRVPDEMTPQAYLSRLERIVDPVLS